MNKYIRQTQMNVDRERWGKMDLQSKTNRSILLYLPLRMCTYVAVWTQHCTYMHIYY